LFYKLLINTQKQREMKKVRSFKDIINHEAVMYVDAKEYDETQPKHDRVPILIGLEEGYVCAYMGCGIISALSKKDAIQMVNQIQKTK